MSQRIILIALLGCAAPSAASALDLLAFFDSPQPATPSTSPSPPPAPTPTGAPWAAAATASDIGGAAPIVFLFLGGYPPDGVPTGLHRHRQQPHGLGLAAAGDLNGGS
jgi:hypothetical protein